MRLVKLHPNKYKIETLYVLLCPKLFDDRTNNIYNEFVKFIKKWVIDYKNSPYVYFNQVEKRPPTTGRVIHNSSRVKCAIKIRRTVLSATISFHVIDLEDDTHSYTKDYKFTNIFQFFLFCCQHRLKPNYNKSVPNVTQSMVDSISKLNYLPNKYVTDIKKPILYVKKERDIVIDSASELDNYEHSITKIVDRVLSHDKDLNKGRTVTLSLNSFDVYKKLNLPTSMDVCKTISGHYSFTISSVSGLAVYTNANNIADVDWDAIHNLIVRIGN